MLAHLNEMIKDSDKLTTTKRAELRGVISTKPGLNRYLRVTPGGLLRIDAAAIKAEENLDGKYLLRCCDPKLPAEDIALGYKQLLEAGVTWATTADELGLLTLGTFTGPAGTFRQTAELTKTQRDLLAKLKIPHPKKIIEATPATL